MVACRVNFLCFVVLKLIFIEISIVAVVIAQDVQAVEGKIINLPCDVVPPGHDKVYMVFWFQHGSGIPIYR